MPNLTPAEVFLCLLVAVAALAWLATRLRVPYPILLTLGGLAISFIPGLPRVELRPDIVFVLFLPPLLYYSALLTSWRDFRANLRPISLLAVGLVLFTMCFIAIVAHTVVGLGWPAAFILGAIVSPPDAVAATAITQRLRVPKRVVTLLEGESMVNDATALICYRLAVAALVGAGGVMGLSVTQAAGQFLLAAVGGIAIGYFVGVVMSWARPHMHDAAVEGVFALLVPYVAYLPAEWLHVSGVLAAVTAGVYMGRRIPRISSSTVRLRQYAVWDTLVFILNGVVFILIGLQLPEVARGLADIGWGTLLAYGAAISGTAIVVRIIWVFPAAYIPRLLPSIRRRDPLPHPRTVFLVGWVGLRGIVSLAAALALPMATAVPQAAWPYERNMILFLTFAVILVTLVGQGLTLPLVIRALGLPSDGIEEHEEELARLEMTNAALSRLQVLAITNEDAADLIEKVRDPYEQRMRYYGPRRVGIEVDGETVCRTTDEVMRVAIQAEREMLVRLRDEGRIGDDVLRKIQTELDLQEARLE